MGFVLYTNVYRRDCMESNPWIHRGYGVYSMNETVRGRKMFITRASAPK
jgi:hypothetical protein